ncbi:fibronectin type III domain-containing protein [Geodermatophilus sp. CPCC 206100]|uniref:fibronectin type III domain-containing protein n=1 Tax=Geodermatophilus sp. CPCC 206100 TaxID=3020054 RepID=UPI003B001C7E
MSAVSGERRSAVRALAAGAVGLSVALGGGVLLPGVAAADDGRTTTHLGTFLPGGGPEDVTVAPGVCELVFVLAGGAGGGYLSAGGNGGSVEARVEVSAGQVFDVRAGAQGDFGNGGYGGAASVVSLVTTTGSGTSAVRELTALLVAAGGGGGGTVPGALGGHGGGAPGDPGADESATAAADAVVDGVTVGGGGPGTAGAGGAAGQMATDHFDGHTGGQWLGADAPEGAGAGGNGHGGGGSGASAYDSGNEGYRGAGGGGGANWIAQDPSISVDWNGRSSIATADGIVDVTAVACPPLPVIVTPASAESDSAGEVRLAWTVQTGDESLDPGWEVSSDGGQTWSALSGVQEDPETGELTATRGGLVEGHEYVFQVRAAKDGRTGPASQAFGAVTVSTRPAPTPATPTTPTTPAPTVPRGPQAPVVPPTVPDAPLTLTTDKGRITEVTPGEELVVVGTGFAPGTDVSVIIYSEPQVLGTVRTDGNGAFRLEVEVPADLAAGRHSLIASGTAPDGTQRFLRMDVTVDAAGVATATDEAGDLAYTGAEPLVPALLGLGALAVGGSLLVVSRRRRTAQD